MPDSRFAQRSVDLAVDNVRGGGKPFACVVVDAASGDVLAEATNQVSQSGDPTAHAEITAIRDLASRGRRDLAGCALPTSQGDVDDPQTPFRAFAAAHPDN